MGHLMRALDWSKTSMGPVDGWSIHLKNALRILLNSICPMYIGWGPEFTLFYNDAYRPILGSKKHPKALGQSMEECFPEIWDTLQPIVQRAVTLGESGTFVDQLLPLERFNFLEECYFTFSCSPLCAENGEAGGIFATVTETTQRVLGERRLRTLRELSAPGGKCDAGRILESLSANPNDLPFALLYQWDGLANTPSLLGSAGMRNGNSPLMSGGGKAWRFEELVPGGQSIVVDDLAERFQPVIAETSGKPVRSAAVLPIGHPTIAGFLVAGINPLRPLDTEYLGFLELVCEAIAAAWSGTPGAGVTREADLFRPESVTHPKERALPLEQSARLRRGERRDVALAARESEQRFRTMADSAPVLIWVSGVDKLCYWFNKPWLTFTGRTLEQEVGNGWVKGVHGDDRTACLKIFFEAFDARVPFTMEYWLKRHDDEYRWVLDNGVPFHAPGGEFLGYIGSCIDITERKMAEDDLRRANLELEQFAESASRDLREPLRTVAIYSQLIRKECGGKLGSEGDMFIDFTVQAARRMETLVKDLVAYTKVTSSHVPQSSVVDMQVVFQEVLSNLKTVTAESHAMVTAGPLPVLRAPQMHMQQLFQNLIANALKFRGAQRPEIHISAEQQEREWLFRVRDNGIGIDPQYHRQVFGIFKRLHSADAHSGTGMGLAICQKIVERHGGRIWVESESGKGATFCFTLPAERGKIR